MLNKSYCSYHWEWSCALQRMFSSLLISWAMLLAAPAWSAALNSVSVLPPAIKPVVGETYFTRYNFWYEGREHVTTNYTRGLLVPINTQVKLVALTTRRMRLALPSEEVVDVELVREFTLRPLAEVASELLGAEPVPIQTLGDDLAASITNGEMRLGMTKEQILMTRGYPPRHRTPSLEANRWVYWSSRFVTLTLIFQDGVLIEGRGLR